MLGFGRNAVAVAVVVSVTLPATVHTQNEVFQPIGPWIVEVGVPARTNGDVLVVRNSLVRTNTVFSDFVLRFEFRLAEFDSEGQVLVRSRFGYGNNPRDERGYRIALTNQPRGDEALGRVTAAEVKMNEISFDPITTGRLTRDWRDCDIRVVRDTLTVQIGGQVVSTVQSLDEFAGYIALRGGRGPGIEFRNVQVRRLPPAREPFGRNAHRPSEGDVELPRVIEKATPFYPREPFDSHIQGVVGLELVVEQNGSVGDVRVVKSLHSDLDEAAIASVRKWRFRPGTKSGQAVDVIVTMEVSFRLRQ